MGTCRACHTNFVFGRAGCDRDKHIIAVSAALPCDRDCRTVRNGTVSQRLASDKNPSGVPLREAFFTVNYALKKVLILVRSGEDLPDVEDWENRPACSISRGPRVVSQSEYRAARRIRGVHVSRRRRRICVVHFPNHDEYPSGATYR